MGFYSCFQEEKLRSDHPLVPAVSQVPLANLMPIWQTYLLNSTIEEVVGAFTESHNNPAG